MQGDARPRELSRGWLCSPQLESLLAGYEKGKIITKSGES